MRYHKGLGVGHIYASLKPDDGILLSDDATTTPSTHRLDVGDKSPLITNLDELCDESPSPRDTINISIDVAHGVADDVGGSSSSGSNSDSDASESNSDDSRKDIDSGDECSDDDVEFDDAYEYGDPLDLDYED